LHILPPPLRHRPAHGDKKTNDGRTDADNPYVKKDDLPNIKHHESDHLTFRVFPLFKKERFGCEAGKQFCLLAEPATTTPTTTTKSNLEKTLSGIFRKTWLRYYICNN